MSDFNITYLKKCKAMARGKGSCVKSGAVIAFEDNEIFVSASKTLDDDDPTAHPAVIAIRKTRLKQRLFLLNNYELYISEKPCPMCQVAIAQAGIENIYYSEKQEIKYMQLTQEILKKAYTLWEF